MSLVMRILHRTRNRKVHVCVLRHLVHLGVYIVLPNLCQFWWLVVFTCWCRGGIEGFSGPAEVTVEKKVSSLSLKFSCCRCESSFLKSHHWSQLIDLKQLLLSSLSFPAFYFYSSDWWFDVWTYWQNGFFEIKGNMFMPVDPDITYGILTDFERNPDIFKTVSKVEVEHNNEGKFVTQHAHWNLMFLSGTFDMKMKVEEDPSRKAVSYKLWVLSSRSLRCAIIFVINLWTLWALLSFFSLILFLWSWL